MPRLEVDAELVRELARLLEETGLAEIEIADGERRVRVAGRQAPAPAAANPPAPVPPATGLARPSATAPAADSGPAIDASHPGAVTSPMVGTVYLGPEPGAPAFVQAGDAVSEGQTLFIVEAMKTMNPIRAPRSGTVSRILVENGAPVEYGEVLLLLQ